MGGVAGKFSNWLRGGGPEEYEDAAPGEKRKRKRGSACALFFKAVKLSITQDCDDDDGGGGLQAEDDENDEQQHRLQRLEQQRYTPIPIDSSPQCNTVADRLTTKKLGGAVAWQYEASAAVVRPEFQVLGDVGQVLAGINAERLTARQRDVERTRQHAAQNGFVEVGRPELEMPLTHLARLQGYGRQQSAMFDLLARSGGQLIAGVVKLLRDKKDFVQQHMLGTHANLLLMRVLRRPRSTKGVVVSVILAYCNNKEIWASTLRSGSLKVKVRIVSDPIAVCKSHIDFIDVEELDICQWIASRGSVVVDPDNMAVSALAWTGRQRPALAKGRSYTGNGLFKFATATASQRFALFNLFKRTDLDFTVPGLLAGLKRRLDLDSKQFSPWTWPSSKLNIKAENRRLAGRDDDGDDGKEQLVITGDRLVDFLQEFETPLPSSVVLENHITRQLPMVQQRGRPAKNNGRLAVRVDRSFLISTNGNSAQLRVLSGFGRSRFVNKEQFDAAAPIRERPVRGQRGGTSNDEEWITPAKRVPGVAKPAETSAPIISMGFFDVLRENDNDAEPQQQQQQLDDDPMAFDDPVEAATPELRVPALDDTRAAAALKHFAQRVSHGAELRANGARAAAADEPAFSFPGGSIVASACCGVQFGLCALEPLATLVGCEATEAGAQRAAICRASAETARALRQSVQTRHVWEQMVDFRNAVVSLGLARCATSFKTMLKLAQRDRFLLQQQEQGDAASSSGPSDSSSNCSSSRSDESSADDEASNEANGSDEDAELATLGPQAVALAPLQKSVAVVAQVVAQNENSTGTLAAAKGLEEDDAALEVLLHRDSAFPELEEGGGPSTLVGMRDLLQSDLKQVLGAADPALICSWLLGSMALVGGQQGPWPLPALGLRRAVEADGGMAGLNASRALDFIKARLKIVTVNPFVKAARATAHVLGQPISQAKITQAAAQGLWEQLLNGSDPDVEDFSGYLFVAANVTAPLLQMPEAAEVNAVLLSVEPGGDEALADQIIAAGELLLPVLVAARPTVTSTIVAAARLSIFKCAAFVMTLSAPLSPHAADVSHVTAAKALVAEYNARLAAARGEYLPELETLTRVSVSGTLTIDRDDAQLHVRDDEGRFNESFDLCPGVCAANAVFASMLEPDVEPNGPITLAEFSITSSSFSSMGAAFRATTLLVKDLQEICSSTGTKTPKVTVGSLRTRLGLITGCRYPEIDGWTVPGGRSLWGGRRCSKFSAPNFKTMVSATSAGTLLLPSEGSWEGFRNEHWKQADRMNKDAALSLIKTFDKERQRRLAVPGAVCNFVDPTTQMELAKSVLAKKPRGRVVSNHIGYSRNIELIGCDGEIVALDDDVGPAGHALRLVAGVRGKWYRHRDAEPQETPALLFFKKPMELRRSSTVTSEVLSLCASWSDAGRLLRVHATVKHTKIKDAVQLPFPDRSMLRKAARLQALTSVHAAAAADDGDGAELDGDGDVQMLEASAVALAAQAEERAHAQLDQQRQQQREHEARRAAACALDELAWPAEELLQQAFAHVLRSQAVLDFLDERAAEREQAEFQVRTGETEEQEAKRRARRLRRWRRRLLKEIRLAFEAKRRAAVESTGHWVLSPQLIPPSHVLPKCKLTAGVLGFANRSFFAMVQLPQAFRDALDTALRGAGVDLANTAAKDATQAWRLGETAVCDPGSRTIATFFHVGRGTLYVFGDNALSHIRRTCLSGAQRDQGIAAASRAAREKIAVENAPPPPPPVPPPPLPQALRNTGIQSLAEAKQRLEQQEAAAAAAAPVVQVLSEEKERLLDCRALQLRAKARRKRNSLYEEIARFCSYAFDCVVMGSLDSGQLMRSDKLSRRAHSDAALLSMAALRKALQHASQSMTAARRFRFFPKENEGCSTRTCPACGVGNHAVGRARTLECPDPACQARVPRDIGAARTIAAMFLQRLYELAEAPAVPPPDADEIKKQRLEAYKKTIKASALRCLGCPQNDSLNQHPPNETAGGHSELLRVDQ